jgi:hypothetical protein
MDPLHITEFASTRYFEKLTQEREQQTRQATQQLQQQQQQQQQPQPLTHLGYPVAGPSFVPPPPPPAPLPIASQDSQFILPIRATRPPEAADEILAQPVEQKQKKSRFGGFSKLLSKSHAVQQPVQHAQPAVPNVTDSYEQLQRLSLSDSLRPRRYAVAPSRAFTLSISKMLTQCDRIPLDELFLALPPELQIQVISSLPLSDILNLRLSSRSWHTMITANEGPIVRHHLDHYIPAYAKRIYPPEYSNLTLHYLCGIWHRLHVASKVSYFICDWVTKEIFLRTSEAQKAEFAPQKERMRRRLIPLLFTMFHFFETYREKHLQYIMNHGGMGLQQTPYTLNPVEVEVMNMYDDRTLLQVHEVFPLVVASFCRRLRPPSYAGRVERSLRGYLKDKPADEVHVAALCVGGLRQVERFWEVKGYNTRRGVVDTWYDSITKEPVEPKKERRGLMGLGRKKSSVGLRDAAAPPTDGFIPPVPALPTRYCAEKMPDRRYSQLVFNTSLSAGLPMGPLPREQLRLLIPDLPILQKMWLTTAEALILDRGIVEKAAEIKRNAAVMLELIREEGMDKDDEWWYGNGTFDSARPTAESMEDDPEDHF